MPMHIAKAVITAAGPGQNLLPLQSFVDLDGSEKSALQIVVEEVVSAGIERIAVIICPGDERSYAEAAGEYAGVLDFIEQPEPRGYGEALYRAADFVSGEPFLHLVSDHLYISRDAKRRCAQQLVETAIVADSAVSAVQPTRESMLAYYGAIGGKLVEEWRDAGDLYEIEEVLEKPTPTEAEQKLLVPGFRAGHYLCLFGMHVLTPAVMELLGQQVQQAGQSKVQLTPALHELARREKYLALVVQGMRYNIGVKYGTLYAQLALSLRGSDREEVLANLIELVAARYESII